MIGKPGPFQIIEDDGIGALDQPMPAPRRRYSCPHYEKCLNLAAALNWDSFTCRGCSGEVDEAVLWRARQAQKRDLVAGKLCDVPEIRHFEITISGSKATPGGSNNISVESISVESAVIPQSESLDKNSEVEPPRMQHAASAALALLRSAGKR